MNKLERQELIKQILQTNKIDSQELLVKLLAKQGVYITQVTLSRDFKDLEVSKCRLEDGSSYYELPFIPAKEQNAQTLKLLISNICLSCICMQQQVFLKARKGGAPLLKDCILQQSLRGVVSALADEDRVWLYCYDAASAQELATFINNYLKK